MQEGNSEITSALSQHGGWLVGALTATWGAILKWALGRYVRQFDEMNVKLASIDHRLSILEGRSMERDNA